MFVRKIEDTEKVEWMEGVEKRLMIGPKDGAPNYIMRVYDISPGTSFPLHAHNYEHEGTVLSGMGALVGKEGELNVEPGDVYFVPPNEPHSMINNGKKVLRLLCTSPLCAYNAMADLANK